MRKPANKTSDITALVKATDRFDGLLKRANKGDETALGSLQKMLKEMPDLATIFDVAGNAERSWLKLYSGDQLGTRELLATELQRIRRELSGPDPAPLESLLVERIVLCWLQLQYADCAYAQNVGDCSFRLGDYLQKRQDRAHWRYLSAIKTLAQVRKLGVPVVQVNVGDKQVNIAGSAPKAAESGRNGAGPSPLDSGATETSDECDLTAGDGR